MPYLVFSNRHELHRLSIQSNVTAPGHNSLLTGLTNAVALDFWHTDEGIDHLFWTDVTSDRIYTGTLYAGSQFNIKDFKFRNGNLILDIYYWA